MSPSTQKQLHLTSKQGSFELVDNQPIPKPGPGWVLVKILAAALNPVDWKVQETGIFIQDYPAVLGTDIAGEVAEVGEGVTNWKVGDKIVFQGTWSKENTRSGFSQYALAEAEYASRIPSNVSVEEASTIPVVLAAVVVGLYGAKPLGVELTPPFVEGGRGKYKDQPLIILGGPTSVGQSALQFAKLSGFNPIITTASLRHEELLKSHGATHVIDRSLSDTEITAQVRLITNKPITLVYDSVSEADTQYTGYKLLTGTAEHPGQLVTVLGNRIEEKDRVENKEVIGTFGVFTVPSTRELGKQLFKEFEGLLQREEVKPNKVEVLEGGLGAIVGGLDRLKKGQVSASKLVVRPQETA